MAPQSIKVLIIEDHQDIREGTQEILELAGYTVYAAPEGKTGVEMATQYLPDIILCDIMMPELDGFGTLYLLSKDERTATIPFIFLTAKSERADMRKAMEMGADDYIVKPFDDVELLNAVETRLQKRRRIAPSVSNRGSNFLSEGELEVLLEDLAANARVRACRKKQLIYQEGDAPLYLYFLRKGKVRTFLYYLDGRELSTEIHVEKEFFGLQPLLLSQPYSDNAEALEDSEIVFIGKDDFFEILFRKPGLAEKVMKLLSGDIRAKEVQLLGFAYDSVRKRVANALVQVADKTVTQAGQDDCLLRVSRDDLAALAGTASETISRILADFRGENLISKEGNAIRIHAISKLKKVKQ